MSERLHSSLILLAVVVSVVALYMLRRVVLLIYVSIIFAVIFTPIVGYIQRIRIGKWSPGKGISILILLLALAVAISLFLLVALPPIINDSQGLTVDLPARISRLQSKLRGLPFGNAIADKLQPAYLGQYAGKLNAERVCCLPRSCRWAQGAAYRGPDDSVLYPRRLAWFPVDPLYGPQTAAGSS